MITPSTTATCQGNGHLLLVGRRIEKLIHLSLYVGNLFLTTTLAVTDDVVARAQSSPHERFDAVVVHMDGSEPPRFFQSVLTKWPHTLFLAPHADALAFTMGDAGALVLPDDEPNIVIQATLLAVSGSRAT